MNPLSAQLVLHGSIVLLASLLFGASYARAIKRQAEAQVVNSWRVAHQSLSIGALLLFAMAYVLPLLGIADVFKWMIAGLFVASGHAFTVATPLAAITKDRGLAAGGHGLARWVYVGNITGAATSLVACGILVLAALVSAFA